MFNVKYEKVYLTRFVPRARRPNVYSRAVVGFGGSSRSKKRNTIVDLPCTQHETTIKHDYYLCHCLRTSIFSSTHKTSWSKPAGNADKDGDEARMSAQLEKSQQIVSIGWTAVYPLTSAPSYITELCVNPSSFCTLVSGTRHSVRPADPSGARQACVRHHRPCLLEQPARQCSERTNT